MCVSIQCYEHQNLKELTVKFDECDRYKNTDILNFMRGCKNLEAFSMEPIFEAEELKNLLHCCSELKSLCTQTRFKELFKVVKNYGQAQKIL